MALRKRMKSNFGVDADYWRIIGVENWFGGAPNQVWPNKSPPVTFVHVALYASREARDSDAMSLEVRRIVLDGQTNGQPPKSPEFRKTPDALPEASRDLAYEALKQLPEFAGAEDV